MKKKYLNFKYDILTLVMFLIQPILKYVKIQMLDSAAKFTQWVDSAH